MTNVVGNTAVEFVVRQIQILNALQAPEGERDWTGEQILTHIKDDSFFKVFDFNGQAVVKLVPEEENFGEVGCVTDGLGNRADVESKFWGRHCVKWLLLMKMTSRSFWKS